MKRLITGLLFSLPITFTLMIFMSVLVEASAPPAPEDTVIPPDLGHIRPEDEPKDKPRINKLPEQELLDKRPTNPTENMPDEEEPTINTLTEPPKLTLSPSGTIPFPANSLGTKSTSIVDQEAIPTLIREPRWPTGVETDGTAKFCFTINSDGTVSNVRLIESKPGKAFVRTARNAIRKWKFKPAYTNGAAINQENMCYTMEFKYPEY